MKRFIITTTSLFMALLVTAGSWYLLKFKPGNKSFVAINTKTEKGRAIAIELFAKARKAKVFVHANGYNTSICFLIDMQIESGTNRFFVYDFEKDSILNAGLVTHGRCNENWLIGRRYGNEVGCGCTSIGKYKIGKPYQGRFGLAYKLYGLDTTNSNAFKRFVVLHSHDCVPAQEVSPAPVCQSDGCPTVSVPFLQSLATIIDESKKPVLLWVFN